MIWGHSWLVSNAFAHRFFLDSLDHQDGKEGRLTYIESHLHNGEPAGGMDAPENSDPDADSEAQNDADLEASVLDTLTDTVLTGQYE